MKFDKPSAARLMRGTLFQYSARHNLQAFLSGPVPPMGVAIARGRVERPPLDARRGFNHVRSWAA